MFVFILFRGFLWKHSCKFNSIAIFHIWETRILRLFFVIFAYKIPKMKEYLDFLTERGRGIYKTIKNHCRKYGIEEVDHMSMAMLANAFDMYARHAKICNDDRPTQGPTAGSDKDGEPFSEDKKGQKGWNQVRPEYTITKQQYDIIIKHSGKFGLTPADREGIFKKIKKDPKEVGFNLN